MSASVNRIRASTEYTASCSGLKKQRMMSHRTEAHLPGAPGAKPQRLPLPPVALGPDHCVPSVHTVKWVGTGAAPQPYPYPPSPHSQENPGYLLLYLLFLLFIILSRRFLNTTNAHFALTHLLKCTDTRRSTDPTCLP